MKRTATTTVAALLSIVLLAGCEGDGETTTDAAVTLGVLGPAELDAPGPMPLGAGDSLGHKLNAEWVWLSTNPPMSPAD